MIRKIAGKPSPLVQKAFRAAQRVRKYSYSPYSRFAVGAALFNKNGLIVDGCNIEDATYKGGVCAERNAIFKAISEGHKNFHGVVIVAAGAQRANPVGPCGYCRQILVEFFPENFEVWLASPQKILRLYSLGELMPHAFSGRDLF